MSANDSTFLDCHGDGNRMKSLMVSPRWRSVFGLACIRRCGLPVCANPVFPFWYRIGPNVTGMPFAYGSMEVDGRISETM